MTDDDVSQPGPTSATEAMARAQALLRQATRVVVLTGAGISTDSGIPDFRGPNGLWTKDPAAERLSSFEHYVRDPELRKRAWQSRVESPTWTAQPNTGHRALVDLERDGRLDTLITQNIDGLHQEAGQDPARVIEIHGTMREVICLSCGDRQPTATVIARVRQGEADPHCLETRGDTECGGLLKSATISFGQSLVADDLARAERAARGCDVLLAVGSTLSVFPAAGVVPMASRAGAAVIIVNAEATEMDMLADVVLRQPIGEVLPVIVVR